MTDAASDWLTESDRLASLDPDASVVFLDTNELNTQECSKADSSFRQNPAEAGIVVGFAADLLAAGLDGHDVAVISLYQDQVDWPRRLVNAEGLEIDTVDGFRGREKEAVIVSVFRTNADGSVGFLSEDRRFNVAVTRTRRKAVVVGDGETVSEADTVDAFQTYAAREGRLVGGRQ